MKDLIDSEEKFLNNLRDSFRMREYYFPIERKPYPIMAYSYEKKEWYIIDPLINAEE